MKNFLIAVLIAFIVLKVFGGLASGLFDLHLVMGDDLISAPLEWLISAGVSVLVVAIGFVIAFSVAAALGIAAICVLGAILFAGIGAFWPLILIIAAVMLIGRSDKAAA